ncbi:insulinase family protein [candidate division WOR-3 bacterium]|nr:insulinase family protein [candidate division WOR-3 bacterium]
MHILAICLISIFQATLDNGLRVVLEEDHSSAITTARIFIDVGSVYETENTGRGLSHFCEHVVSGGTTPFRTEKQYEELEKRFGARTNAYTSWEVTCYHTTVPSDYSDSAIMMLMEQVFSCSLDSFEISREHGVIHHEILTSDTPDERVWDAAFVFFFGNHPLSVPILGLEDAMLSITREDIYKFYCARYSPSNAVLVAVGDFQTSELFEFIEKQAQKFHSRPYLPSTVPSPPQYSHPRTDTVFEDIPHPLVYMMWNGAQKTADDYDALSLLSQYLTGGQSSYLEKLLVEEKELSFETWTYNMGLRRMPGAFVVFNASPDMEKLHNAVGVIQREIDRIAAGDIDEARLSRTKNLIRYSLLKEWTAGTKAQLIGDGMLTSNDPLYFQNSIEKYSRITSADLSEISQRLLSSSKRQTFFALPSALKEELIPNERYSGQIPFTLHEREGSPALLSQRTPGSQYVSMLVTFGGGSRVDPVGAEGTCRVISEILGLKTTYMNSDRFSEKLDELGISRRSSCSDDYFYIYFDFPLENFDSAVELIGKAISAPDFSDQGTRDAKKSLSFEIAQSSTNPNYLHGKFFRNNFFPQNTYNRYPDENSMAEISRENLEKLYREIKSSGNVVVAITGDVDPEKAQKALSANFPALNAGSSLASGRPVENIYPRSDSLIYEFQQTLVTYAFKTVPWGHPDGPALLILDELLSGANSRIHDALRGRQDLVYWGWGYQASYGDAGAFIFISQTSQKNQDKVKEAYLAEIERVKTELLSQEELDNLRNAIFSSWDMSEQDQLRRLFRYSFLYLMGQPPDYYSSNLSPSLESLTPEDILDAAVLYFDKGYWFISRPDNSDY